MKWAGRRANEGCSVLAMLSSVNACRGSEELVPDSEVASIARSIERYRHRWAAGAIPGQQHVATKADIADLKADITRDLWIMGVGIVAAIVTLTRVLA